MEMRQSEENHTGTLTGGFGRVKAHSVKALFGLSTALQLAVAAGLAFFAVNGEGEARPLAVVVLIFVLLSVGVGAWNTVRILSSAKRLKASAEKLADGSVAVYTEEEPPFDEFSALDEPLAVAEERINRLELNRIAQERELKAREAMIKKLSVTDELTGVASRSHFDQTLKTVWNVALRHERPVALFMIDLDYFEGYNRAYGEEAGDDCLRTLGELLGSRIRRATDLVARFEGEAFVILIQEADHDKVEGFAHDIRKSIETLNIEHGTSPFGRITASIGVACMTPSLPTMGRSHDTLINLASHALADAKESGRNSVCQRRDSLEAVAARRMF